MEWGISKNKNKNNEDEKEKEKEKKGNLCVRWGEQRRVQSVSSPTTHTTNANIKS